MDKEKNELHHHEHGEDCGCGHDHEHEHFVVDLEDDNGNVISCPIIDAFEFEDKEYILAQDPNEDSVYLFRAAENGELEVPEEDEFDRVSKFYSEELED
ncbi:DUF1292 domain-containing protein [Caproiciproducens sp. MSJ-32]|uniref:DUF1292 domain-containing protein n=1 Tax=Caproiciproducens sp. MSJ-32 TaxID=2841527 RepID=UPI001C11FB0C|nr:DUF1292 domain-containing protein [Caproiciproducens sp. MSJ-32]MBU5454635.1 DUF1292 domain-containing protein [Caproiciproducens sp. MSJ-32]